MAGDTGWNGATCAPGNAASTRSTVATCSGVISLRRWPVYDGTSQNSPSSSEWKQIWTPSARKDAMSAAVMLFDATVDTATAGRAGDAGGGGTFRGVPGIPVVGRRLTFAHSTQVSADSAQPLFTM